MKSESQVVSDFAASLRRLLDETGIFDRREWSRFLNVSGAAISQWLTDKTIPRPETLRMIVELVRSNKNAPREPLQQFDAMSANPSVEVSPHGKRMGESVRSYLVSPLVEGFLLDLKGLEPVKQTRVLLKASMLCAEESGLYQPPVAPVYQVNEDLPVQNSLATGLARAEAAVKTIEEKIPDFVSKVMGYLTSRPNEALTDDVRTFCVRALDVMRSQLNTSPKRLITTILESKAIDSSRFDRFFEPDALNAVFLANEETTTILVRQPNGEYRPHPRIGTEIEQDVLILRGHEVLYCPSDRLASFYKNIKPRELEDAA